MHNLPKITRHRRRRRSANAGDDDDDDDSNNNNVSARFHIDIDRKTALFKSAHNDHKSRMQMYRNNSHLAFYLQSYFRGHFVFCIHNIYEIKITL